MKKILFSFFLISLLSACSKDEGLDPVSQGSAFEQRLQGNWQLVGVKYDTEVPNPLNPTMPIEVKGDGINVTGGHTIGYEPNTIEYSYNFTAEADFGGTKIPIPSSREADGEWILNGAEDKIFITDEDGSTTIWDVIVNEENKQVYRGEVTETFQSFTIVIDTELTFER
jgi:hypothetical protein